MSDSSSLKEKESLKTMKKHIVFTPEEDKNLILLVNQLGINNWETIALYMKNRTKRQCKDRYMLFLAPTITNLPWTYEEDVKLYEMVKMFGKKWTILVRFFNGRSVVNLKNRYKMRVESMMEQDVNSPVMDNLSQTSCYTIPLIHHSNKHE